MILLRAAWAALFLLGVVDVINSRLAAICRGKQAGDLRSPLQDSAWENFCLQLYLILHVFIDKGNSYEFLKTTALFIDLYFFYGIMYT